MSNTVKMVTQKKSVSASPPVESCDMCCLLPVPLALVLAPLAGYRQTTSTRMIVHSLLSSSAGPWKF